MKRIQKIWWLLGSIGLLITGGCGFGKSDMSLIQPTRTEAAYDTETVYESSAGGEKDTFNGKVLYVHICGEVKVPGVYAMPEGSRLVDVVNAAGGLLPEADVSTVNLAGEAEDGMQVWIPAKAKPERETDTDGRIDINRAAREELCSLPGIGERKAEDIIRYREQNGAFESIEEIMKVTGIKQGLYEKIKEKICVR